MISIFFLNNFCNHVAERPDLPWAQYLIGLKFRTVSDYPTLIGLSGFANWTQSGKKEEKVEFPFALVFQPNPALTAQFDNTTDYDIPELFSKSFTGTEVLYKVYGVKNPSATTVDYLGDLQLTSKFVATNYGDVALFFRHIFKELDFKFYPDWEAQYNQDDRYQREGVNMYSPWLPPYGNSDEEL